MMMQRRESHHYYVERIDFKDFRHFSNAEVRNLTSKNLIMGENGSGKTTILWGIVLLLRAYNSHHTMASVPLKADELTELLNWGFEFLYFLKDLIRQGAEEVLDDLPFCRTRPLLLPTPQPHCQVVGKIAGDHDKLTCVIRPNGELMVLHPSSVSCPEHPKIRFALVGSEVHLCAGRKEVVALDLLSSSRQSHRYRYESLTDEHKVRRYPQ